MARLWNFAGYRVHAQTGAAQIESRSIVSCFCRACAWQPARRSEPCAVSGTFSPLSGGRAARRATHNP
jgi:hypothetical protein